MSTRAIRTRSRSPAAPREVAGKSTGLSAQRAAVDGLLGLLCDRLDHGVLLRYTGDILALGPAAVASADDIGMMVDTLRSALRAVA